MTSQIVSTTIDSTYPVAGVDNDTQGFRDNFQIIKDNFAFAASEITALQNRVLLKDALPDTTLDNNMNGNSIVAVNLDQATEKYHNAGTLIAGQSISFLNGHFQTVRLNLPEETDNIVLTLADWPTETERVAKMTVELYGNDTPKTVIWVVEGGGPIKTNSSFPTTFTVDSSTNPIVVDFWTYSNGSTVFAEYKGRFEE